ncbi:PREDICTED: lipocalin-15 [Galeopterus variegatus]|uniref:Lipocalin-15 n=1 Tax=Galeopterus variegatus TaxID=482537 RepID=A0ABM0SHQ6_GALVR|nr:PREDICTED: lipocalin-15 [Galeopterus variegatus]
MKSVLLSLVLALLWVSSAQAEVLVQPNFDAKKFSGLWYVVSMVSDCKVFQEKRDHLLMFTSTVQATTEGDLSVHLEFPQADGCNQVDAQYLKVGSEGHFRVPGRTQDASPQAVRAFQDFYPTVGLPDDMVVMLPKSDACSSEGKEAP